MHTPGVPPLPRPPAPPRPRAADTMDGFVRHLAPLIESWTKPEPPDQFEPNETFRKDREKQRHQCAADLVNAVGNALLELHGFRLPNKRV